MRSATSLNPRWMRLPVPGATVSDSLGREYVKLYVLLPPVKETTHNTSPAFKQAYPIRASVPRQEIISGSAKPESNNPSGIFLPNHRLGFTPKTREQNRNNYCQTPSKTVLQDIGKG